jgi:hypothetical protein
MKNYFRIPPTPELINKCLVATGLEDINDTRFMVSSYMKQDDIKKLIDELRFYYFPVFVKLYLDREQTFGHWITIIRQLLKTRGCGLERKEYRRRIDTSTYFFESKYRIIPPPTRDTPAVIKFL